MNNDIYKRLLEFKSKYPKTIAFRIKKHAKIVSKFVGTDEEVKYAFIAQKNFKSTEISNTYVVVLTNRRLLLASKRLIFGYYYKSITPDLFNDLTIKNGIIWGKVIIDTVKEKIILSNLDSNSLAEIDDNITGMMIEEKKKCGRESKVEE